jgi:hypothetical protein
MSAGWDRRGGLSEHVEWQADGTFWDTWDLCVRHIGSIGPLVSFDGSVRHLPKAARADPAHDSPSS